MIVKSASVSTTTNEEEIPELNGTWKPGNLEWEFKHAPYYI